MAHDLEKLANGYSFVYNIEEGLPWHGLGNGVKGKMTANECITGGGLDWPVTKEPVFARNLQGEYTEIPDRFAMTRGTDGKVLGVVGKDYKPIQNIEAFNFFDTLVDDGEAKYETAGSLSGGKRIFLTARIGDDFQVGGLDSHRLYLALLSSHDGSKSLTALTTVIRIVCANTEQMAIAGAKTSWTMTHRQTLEGKVMQARESLKLSKKYFDAFDLEAQKMMAIQLTTDKFREIMTDVLPKQKRQLPKNLDTLTAIYENSPTINDTGAGGTAWGGYNAVTEWLTHGREVRSQEARMVNTIWGFGNQVRGKTHERLMALAV